MNHNWDVEKSENVKRLRKNERDVLKELLAECSQKQQNLFKKMYNSVDTIPKEKIEWAIVQCENTIRENQLKKN